MAAPIPASAQTPPLAATASSRGVGAAGRVGLIIAALLGFGDIVFGFGQLQPGETIPNTVSAFMIVAGVLTVVAVPFAWRGVGWATWLIVVVRLLSALTGLPAFFVPGVPAEFVIAAAVGIILAVLVGVLLLISPRRARS